MIVGGGPTGVEVAAELHDLITEDLVKLYPDEVGSHCPHCAPAPCARAPPSPPPPPSNAPTHPNPTARPTVGARWEPCCGWRGGRASARQGVERCRAAPSACIQAGSSRQGVRPDRSSCCLCSRLQVKDVSIRVIELMDHVLSMYDRAIGEYTARE